MPKNQELYENESDVDRLLGTRRTYIYCDPQQHHFDPHSSALVLTRYSVRKRENFSLKRPITIGASFLFSQLSRRQKRQGYMLILNSVSPHPRSPCRYRTHLNMQDSNPTVTEPERVGAFALFWLL
ncbi:hypothetical protein TWF132_009670 [Orbilia oligospora]|nr:hypothetical protein TWF128_009091 [Orbilia oligospora]KAF3285009.1 hypothetical protein TWF132_009670 [Orbilia oligospora]